DSFRPVDPPTIPALHTNSHPSNSRRKTPCPAGWSRADPLPPDLHCADLPSKDPRRAGSPSAAPHLAGSQPSDRRLLNPLPQNGLALLLFRPSPPTHDAGRALLQTPADRPYRPISSPAQPSLRLLLLRSVQRRVRVSRLALAPRPLPAEPLPPLHPLAKVAK